MYKNICRLCLSNQNSDKFVSLIENNSANGLSCYGKSVKKFAEINIEKDDKFPKSMCQKCLFLLKCAIYFKFKCESSEKTLKEWAQKHVKMRRRETKYTLESYQNTLFKEYFPEVTNAIASATDDSSKFVVNLTKDIKNVDESEYSNDDDIDMNFPPDDFQESDKYASLHNEMFHMLKENVDCTKNTLKKPQKKHINRQKNIIKRDKYECNICKKVLANPVTYSNHMEYHTGCRYICEHCGKGYPVLSRLQAHQIVAHGTGPSLPCQYCSYKAPTKLYLTEHLRLHTGERPFTCDKCGMTFRRQAIWKKHMIHHMEKTVQCRQCPRKFFTVPDMQAHSNNMHERLYMYSCHKCEAMYAKTETVRKHLTERHGIPREMQGKVIRVQWGKPKNNVVEP